MQNKELRTRFISYIMLITYLEGVVETRERGMIKSSQEVLLSEYMINLP